MTCNRTAEVRSSILLGSTMVSHQRPALLSRVRRNAAIRPHAAFRDARKTALHESGFALPPNSSPIEKN
jgi:hypothetical protein